MAINNIINDQWQGHSHGEVEDALKALLAQMIQDIEAAGIPAGGVTAEMLATALRTKIANAVTAIQVNGSSRPSNNGIVTLDPYYTKTQIDGMLDDVDDALGELADVATSGSYNDLADKPTILSQQQVQNLIEAALEDIDLDVDIPTKTSDLVNDSGFVTDEDIEDFVTAESIEEIVMGSADVSVIEADGYINIVFATASITVKVGNDEVSGISLHTDGTAHESEQLTISGSHLKANIIASLSGTDASDFELSTDGTNYGSTATIAVTNEAVSGASLYVRYKGATTADTAADATLTLTAGSVSKDITLHYSYASGPYISVLPASLTIKAATGQSNTGTLQVTGLNLTAGITATVSSTGFTVSSSENGTYGNQASLPSSGGTLYVKFSPTGSTGSTGTLTLSSTGATSKTVNLTGAVVSLTVSESSLSFNTTAGTPATQTFTVQGANLTQDISISASGTGFSVSPATIDKDDAATEQTVTVTYSPSETGTNTGSITLQSGGASATVTLEGTASAGLPTGYTKLTYLQGITRQMQSPAISYPQTWEFDVQCDALTTAVQILACATSSGGKWIGASNNGKWGVGITDATCTTVQVTTRATILATLKSTGVEITIGNETITRDADSALTGYVFLFGCNETDKRLFGGKVYGVRLVSGGTADLVLASRDSDGQQGIYNLTNNTFYGLT